MKKKVFISSTYLDLANYRKGIWKLLRNYNVTISGMESFGARKSDVLSTCLREVEKADVFLCVIAMKYGSIEETSNKSYTQLEYEKAIKCNLDVLVYLIDENNGLVLPKNVDIGKNAESLKLFKEQIKKTHTPDYFFSEKHLLKSLKLEFDSRFMPIRRYIECPRELVCKTTEFKVRGSDWIAFVSYLYGYPYQLFTSPYDKNQIGKIPSNGTIEYLIEHDVEIICFSYIDKYGYKNIIEGIDYYKDGVTRRYDKIITKLLILDTPISVINEVINEMDIVDIDNSDEWKKGIVKALGKK